MQYWVVSVVMTCLHQVDKSSELWRYFGQQKNDAVKNLEEAYKFCRCCLSCLSSLLSAKAE